MIKNNYHHKPVLLNESINLFSNIKNSIFIDGTFGDGGHSKAILEKYKSCKVYALDRDPDVKYNANFFKKKYENRFKFICGKISDLEKIAENENLKNKINGVHTNFHYKHANYTHLKSCINCIGEIHLFQEY